MPPAPKFTDDELHFEMAELYLMALARDIPFSEWSESVEIGTYIDILNEFPWIRDDPPLEISDEARGRRRPTQVMDTVFRGIGPGVTSGLYLSQFLLRGTKKLINGTDADVRRGHVVYGPIRFDQRVRNITAGVDYMTTWENFIDVQNGADLRLLDLPVEGADEYRFITTPRDLATWVHFDALYQAYLNALLILIADNAPLDPGLPFQDGARVAHQVGFATFGGPHILSLLTEVATRALKAVWFQKYSNHRRVRPEAVGGLVHRNIVTSGVEFPEVNSLTAALDPILNRVSAHNQAQNMRDDRNADASANEYSYLLPMPFPEGSPMHPAYGSGHATVAGACVTILKAWFDSDFRLNKLYQAGTGGSTLVEVTLQQAGLEEYPTLTEELNKLAANIGVGRSWAGVHYWTDYYESILLGERVAIGILEEQKLTYGENFTMTLPKFDGTTIVI